MRDDNAAGKQMLQLDAVIPSAVQPINSGDDGAGSHIRNTAAGNNSRRKRRVVDNRHHSNSNDAELGVAVHSHNNSRLESGLRQRQPDFRGHRRWRHLLIHGHFDDR